MQIFVINLAQDVKRREYISRQLDELGLPYEIFPAILGRDLSEAERNKHLDDVWFRRYEGRSALPGDLGCSLSHIEVYRTIINKDLDHALILEDDAWLNPNLPQILKAISRGYSPDEPNILLLTWFRAIVLSEFDDLWASYHVAKVSSAYCAHGYVVSNSAAKVLVETLYPVRHVADCWNWLSRHRIINLLVVFPTCITVDMSFEVRTTPELAGQRKTRPLHRRITRKIYRGFWMAVDRLAAWTRIRRLRP